MDRIRSLEHLLQCPLHSNGDVRYKVKLLVDPAIERYYRSGAKCSWHERIAAGQFRLRYDFYEQFGICLDFSDVHSWEHTHSTLFGAAMAAERIPLDEADIVVGLALIRGEKYTGLAKMNGRFCVVNMYETWIITELHEVGHLFGARHSNDVTSIMYPESLFLRSCWDECNRRRILDNKYRFRK